MLSSPAISNGDLLPADLKCRPDGGDGLTPHLQWTGLPSGTQSLAIIMDNYPRGTTQGIDAPSQYWLLWNIPADILALDRGNPQSIGDDGSDKDGKNVGYTPPCSPPGPKHEYTITLFALSDAPGTLPHSDDMNVDWTQLTA